MDYLHHASNTTARGAGVWRAPEVAASDQLLAVIQDDVCKSLLQASRTENVSVRRTPPELHLGRGEGGETRQNTFGANTLFKVAVQILRNSFEPLWGQRV